MSILGVDISEHNGSVDFVKLKSAGVKFVMIRCGYGGNYISQDDKRFKENVAKAELSEIPWGTYLYSYAKTANMAHSEADHVIRLLNGKNPQYGVWYDVEDSLISGYDIADNCVTFCEDIQKSGYYCGIYSFLSWLDGRLKDSRLDKYDKWVAQWNSTCDYQKPYGIWQYTDNLVIGGKVFDGNYAYKDYPALTKKEEETVTYERWKEFQQRYKKEQAAKEASEWAKPAVAYCKDHGIMSGDKDGNFRPQDTITRQEVAQIAMNLHKELTKE